MAEGPLSVEVSTGPVGNLSWAGEAAVEQLQQAINTAAEEAFGRGARRLEVTVAAEDHGARRAVQRAGFRLEGVRRQARTEPDGRWSDLALFARLATDQVGGRSGFSSVMNAALPRKRVIAHVLMRDTEGRMLLCETQFKRDWELPGGIVEPGEPPRSAAVREVREELGLDLSVGRLLMADWMPPYLGWEDALELIFDGGVVSPGDLGRYVLQPAEIKSVRLCTLEQAEELVTPLSHRRLTIAARLAPGDTVYLENGYLENGYLEQG